MAPRLVMLCIFIGAGIYFAKIIFGLNLGFYSFSRNNSSGTSDNFDQTTPIPTTTTTPIPTTTTTPIPTTTTTPIPTTTTTTTTATSTATSTSGSYFF